MSSGGSTAALAAAATAAIVASSGRSAVERLLRRGKAQRPVGNTDHAECACAPCRAVLIIKQRRARCGEIAAAAGEFRKAEAALPGPWRQTNCGDDLVGFERRHQRAKEKVACRDRRAAGFADDGDLGVAGDRNARHFGCGIGMRDAAADRAAIADLIMRDMRRWRRPEADAPSATAHHREYRASAPWRRA